jgi:hypothetical protein
MFLTLLEPSIVFKTNEANKFCRNTDQREENPLHCALVYGPLCTAVALLVGAAVEAVLTGVDGFTNDVTGIILKAQSKI